jgi:hypothetical protein
VDIGGEVKFVFCQYSIEDNNNLFFLRGSILRNFVMF